MSVEHQLMDQQSLDEFLARKHLVRQGERGRWTPLTGGVSSDIWRVDLASGPLCVKRALAKLKVAADWQAPTSRNAYEWAWLRFASEHVPEAVPRPLAHDPDAGLFAMAFLDPADHPVWKAQLMNGVADPAVAAAVGQTLATLHAKSAHDPSLAQAFDTLDNFHALRLEPYLLATGRRHPELAAHLSALSERTGALKIALVHGDVSPKNILVGPRGPVLLDAECAWYGDPAFDIAFCLNHLLLKCLVRPGQVDACLRCFDAFAFTYLDLCTWESRDELESRAANLLPGLFLARVDGKSPVEYLHDEGARQLVRDCAFPLILHPPTTLDEVKQAWRSLLLK
jgi:5-methylthioribose kinase